jgi:hypothetical protein
MAISKEAAFVGTVKIIRRESTATSAGRASSVRTENQNPIVMLVRFVDAIQDFPLEIVLKEPEFVNVNQTSQELTVIVAIWATSNIRNVNRAIATTMELWTKFAMSAGVLALVNRIMLAWNAINAQTLIMISRIAQFATATLGDPQMVSAIKQPGNVCAITVSAVVAAINAVTVITIILHAVLVIVTLPAQLRRFATKQVAFASANLDMKELVAIGAHLGITIIQKFENVIAILPDQSMIFVTQKLAVVHAKTTSPAELVIFALQDTTNFPNV